ncbi:hypothetical protein HPB50_015454 [Hyalomma asiaticum]|uniref:Uncharacterized protein n=1 Tax=Hyalomma asiaticum TaxID=266040 RepID=A0ACB7T310_HYAAI|nr:hypothetical protein HPB50_015454 [Hyalomma asiaticum]
MNGKNSDNVHATGSEVHSGASKSKQVPKKYRRTSSKARSKSPGRSSVNRRRRFGDHAPRKKSSKQRSSSPVGSVMSYSGSPTTEGQPSCKEALETTTGECRSALSPAAGGRQQSEAVAGSDVDEEYTPRDGQMKVAQVITECTVNPLFPVEPHSRSSEGVAPGICKKQQEYVRSSRSAGTRPLSRGTTEVVVSDSSSAPRDRPQPRIPTDAHHLRSAQISETEPLYTLRSRGKMPRSPKTSTILKRPRQSGSLDAVADIRELSFASEKTLANTTGDRGEQVFTAGWRDIRAASLSKSAAGTSMSYRPITYRGSVRLVRSGGNAEFLSIVVAIDVLFVLLTILVGIRFAATGPEKPNSTTQQGYTFCCKEEATKFAAVIDTAVSPCNSLYEYVCRKVQQTDNSTDVELVSGVENSIFDGPLLSSSTGRAGQLLRHYYMSCSHTVNESNLTQIAADVVAFLLDSGVVKAKMSSRSVVGSFFSTILPIGGFFIVNIKITQQPVAHTMIVKLAEPENLTACDHCKGIMQVINQRMGTNFTTEDVQRFRSAAVLKTLCTASTGSIHLLKNLFHVVQPSDIEMILNSSLLMNSSLSPIVVTVYCFDEISDLISSLSAPSHQPLSSAFLVADAAARLVGQLFAVIPDKERKTTFCKTQARALRNLWNDYLVDHAVTVEKNIVVANLYESVKAAVLKSFLDQKVFDEHAGEQRVAIDIIDGMVMVLPGDSLPTGLSLPSTPNTSLTLLAHYYYMQRYEFLADRIRVFQDLPDSATNLGSVAVRRGHKLYIPAGYYLSLQHASKWLSLIHFPKLGAMLASFMWHAVLYERDWSPKTTLRIRGFTECFGSKYLGKLRIGEPERMIAGSALALHSLKRASRDDDLSYVPVEVTEGFMLSHAQFFYLSWAFGKCLYDGPGGKDVAVNIPATYVGDFRKVFGCPVGSYMTYGNWCPL